MFLRVLCSVRYVGNLITPYNSKLNGIPTVSSLSILLQNRYYTQSPLSIADQVANAIADRQQQSTLTPLSTDEHPSFGELWKDAGKAANQIRFFVPRKPVRFSRGEGVGGGQVGRISQLRKCVAALTREERIELPWLLACETRQYMECLIQTVLRAAVEAGTVEGLLLPPVENVEQADYDENLIQGDDNEKTMRLVPLDTATLELMEFWLMERDMMEKMVKVLLPRYIGYSRTYTRLFRLIQTKYPHEYSFNSHGFGVLELHGNPWPPINRPHLTPNATPEELYSSTEDPDDDRPTVVRNQDKFLQNVLISGAANDKRLKRISKRGKKE